MKEIELFNLDLRESIVFAQLAKSLKYCDSWELAICVKQLVKAADLIRDYPNRVLHN